MPQHTNLRLLSDIADIRTGYTFREKVDEVEESIGTARIAQIKDVREIAETSNSFLLDPSQLPAIDWQGKEKALVSAGTVILPSRGSRGGYFQASCVMQSSGDALPLVVTSQFLVITPKADVLPEFLCWSLNQPAIQFLLSEGAGSQGSAMAVMLKTSIGNEIQLTIPSIERQKKILHLNQLWEKEQALTQALLTNRKTMLQGMFQQLLNENK
ncbi:restriction endonuclease subunit S [Vibrio parahaemolyticus]|uniref:Restriction endonuclease subunit S n=1 Tax=Vibrio parahaemolyticus TaxID=670 RepID=A0A7Y0XAD4_VIBPH|nr:restriction endonuclease subunit S [Vibrio parahaemolyticus]MDF4557988.1 restriction endonuclease subunit S [Vibrio parahaemolyticus]MDF5019003.1 restriction endonuclease subunit S [Vibrio parahaemolyticus]MDF5098197.1 restriction endonuclease subunit S [Vibrio parahaemolyticus]MDF5118824.1 restriction endonuclease subunit S [Vibrio parahaemolyticus]MDF5182544.1 restriction endonuclease subunit S [Vibrio parahaemolyticus]